MNATPHRFQWRAFTSVLITISFITLAVTGVMLFVSPPGRVANWTNWTLLGLTKREWIGLHVGFSALFLAVTFFHLVFNWRPLLGYFKDRWTRRLGLRWEWAGALAAFGLVFAGIQSGLPPFSALLSLSESVKEIWDQPAQRAPIPHAELLTLAELAEKAGVSLPEAVARLEAKGIQGASSDIVVDELARQNQRAAQQLYAMILGEPTRGGAGHGAGLGGGGPGGAGGGPGWKTLTQFCAEEGLDVDQALARLKAKGLTASSGQTLREIAVDNGYPRPFEILELLRGTAQ